MITLLLLFVVFCLCFLLNLWATVNMAVAVVTGRTHHWDGPQSPTGTVELHPQHH